MQIYLPIAELSVSAESMLALGSVVGFLSGLFGVGGGFLTTPFLLFLGIPAAIAVGTQATQLVAAGVSGTLGHWKRGDVDVKMAGVMLAGSVLGSLIGVVIFRFLERIGQIDLFIPAIYVLLLGSMGALMLWESVTNIVKHPKKKPQHDYLYHNRFFQMLPYKMRFPRSRLYVSALVPAGIGFVGGILVATMGIGGGFVLVPAMIYILGMPTLLVAGTSLFQIVCVSALTAVMHSVANQSVDLILAALLIVGGVIGAQFGVRASKKVRGVYARITLAVLLLLVAFRLLGVLFIAPVEFYSITVRF